MSDDFGKFLDHAQGGGRSESRFANLETELERHDPVRRRARYLYQCRVFTLFRPWEECSRCGRLFRPHKDADGNWQEPDQRMPEGEDFVCPHNANEEYVDLINRISRGEVRLIHRMIETLKSGVVQALVEWGEPLQREPKEEGPGLPRL